MKRLLVLVLTCVGLSAYADTYYVDANRGNDSWDGTADYEHRDESRGVGPRKQLVEVMKLATKSGDVVYAAPGTYAEGAAKKSDSDATLNRVVIPAGVRLESTEGAEKTFIVGADATTSPDANGLGVGATRCVALNADSSVVGFTLTGGRTGKSGDDGKNGAVFGAGDWSVGETYVVSDCIVTNNRATSFFAGAGVTWIRCRIVGEGKAGQIGRYYNCYVRGSSTNPSTQVIEQPRIVYGCTVWGSVNTRLGGSYSSDVYNSLVYEVFKVNAEDVTKSGDLYDSVYVKCDASAGIFGDCRQVTDAEFKAIPLDADGRTTSALLHDAGNNAWVDSVPSSSTTSTLIPSGFDSGLDAGGGARIYNGRVDIGAWEYDIRPDISSALAAERVTVKSVTPNVRVTDYNLPVLTNGSAMAVEWTAKGAGEIAYGFIAQVTGEGTLSCYKENEAKPFETVIADDGAKQVAFTSSGSTVPLRFVFEGEGTATVSKFVDEVSATVIDAKGGLTLTGIGPGKTVVEPGQMLTFTVSRNFNTDRLCTGFVLNSTDFVDFNDYPDGWTHMLDTPFSSVTIEAQYKTAQDFYVDPVNGDDAKCGFLPSEAWKTLVAISTNGNVRSGDTVYAAAGTYAEGAIKVNDTHKTFNRVVVPAGVTLKSLEGAAKTFIVGAAAPNADANGLGDGATRCVALGGTGAAVVGFTLTGGRTASGSGYPDAYSAAVLGQGQYDVGVGYVAANCIVEDVFAGKAGAGCAVTWVRCTMTTDFPSQECLGAMGQYYYCYIKGTYATYRVLDQPRFCYGCTINGSMLLRKGARDGSGVPAYISTLYNSIVLNIELPGAPATECGDLYGCLYSSLGVGGEAFDSTQISKEDFLKLPFAADGRVASDLVRNAGSNALVEQLPVQSAGGNIPDSYIPVGFDPALDLGMGQRVYEGRVDRGAWEYDIRPDVAAALAAQRVEVTALSPDVTVTDGNLPVLGDGGTMAVAWTKPSVGGGQYVFTAEVTGEGTLYCYKDGAAEPFATVTEATGATRVDFTSEADTVNLRFAFAGEGSATLSRFIDQVFATVTDAKGGLVGLPVGTKVFDPANPQTVTITRNFSTDRLCTGFILNGKDFIDFKDYPNGWTHTFDSLESSVTIEAQYKTAQDFYVDPENGDDARSGFLPGEAWKTLATIATNANVRSGDTVYAAAGTYAEGSVKRVDEALTLNRVVVPPGVRLESLEGAEKTVIVGAPAPGVATDESPWGLGAGATRCVALGKDAVIVGFTLTGGRTGTAEGTSGKDHWGGAVFGNTYEWDAGVGYTVMDCIVSNNVANAYPAAAAVTWVRCNIVANGRPDTADYCCLCGSFYNCNVSGNAAKYWVLEQPQAVYGCRFDDGVQFGHASLTKTIYNSIIRSIANVNAGADVPATAYLADCVFVSTNACIAVTGNSRQIKLDEYTAMGFDGEGRTTSALVRDQGNNEWAYAVPAEFGPMLDKGRGQRIYGGAVDVGPYEYDLRGDFRRDLSRKLTVTSASTNVVETAAHKVLLTDGQSVAVELAARQTKPLRMIFPFAVTDGTLAIAVNGTLVREATADGEWSYELKPGDEVVFSFAGSGSAELGRVIGDGILLMVR